MGVKEVIVQYEADVILHRQLMLLAEQSKDCGDKRELCLISKTMAELTTVMKAETLTTVARDVVDGEIKLDGPNALFIGTEFPDNPKKGDVWMFGKHQVVFLA